MMFRYMDITYLFIYLCEHKKTARPLTLQLLMMD